LHILFLLLLPLTISGQEKSKGSWSGSAGLYGGTNFQKTQLGKKSHNVGGVSGSLNYSTDKFGINLFAVSSYDHLFSGGMAKTITSLESTSTEAYDGSANEATDFFTEAGFGLDWRPSSNDKYGLDYKFSFNHAEPSNWIASTGPIDDVLGAAFSQELANNYTRSHDVSFSYQHIYNKPGRDLQITGSASFLDNGNCSNWTVGDITGEKKREKRIDLRQYRMNPSTDNAEYKLGATFTDKRFAGVDGLDLKFLLNTKFKLLNDHTRGANLVNGEWKDSTSIREDFCYRTFTLTPSVKVNFKRGFYKLDATLSPELFSQKLDSGTKIGDISKTPLAFTCSINNTFEPWNGHRFTLNYGRSISRPGYLQVCWFLRPGSQDSNELYQGNQDLMPAITNKIKGGYNFTYKRFSATLSLGYTNKNKKIEKTYSNKEIDGREYRVYTWINGGMSNETNTSLNLSWNGERFHFGVEGYYNFFRGLSSKGSESRSNDYGVTTDVEYNVKSWVFRMDSAYQSDVERSYVSLASRLVTNARISKQIGRFNIYLDGKDLFDMPIVTTTMSEDESEYRYEETHFNRRLFVLGVDFSF